LEKEKFENKYFNELLQNIKPNEQTTAAKEINELKKILDRFDVRLNVFAFLFLNSFLLWDTRQMLSLIEWKKRNSNYLNKWFDAIAATEISISLATLHFNQPNFSFPEIKEEHFVFEGVEVGHPLIVESKRVNNSFSLAGTGKVALVTGSNMGGKSTFLRSIGVNTILALMGSPVCAKYFAISNIELMSSMRIADNLAESTSTFYAELKKLQTIIEAVKANKKVFILLDEILRGTNSLDRHTGSKALIKQLINQHAVAIIATHDVDLANMETTDFPEAINNYHFDVQVANDELYFDYKLKQGICQSLNASILMRKIGIEME
jgi:DNA mismatch repair ATPase MutS